MLFHIYMREREREREREIHLDVASHILQIYDI